MKDRIIQFLKENNLSSTRFADIIGVQRSSISHILSGRNKPSFDFIEKMLIAYPGLNAQWLITGIGSMKLENNPKNYEPDLFHQVKSVNNETQSELNIPKQTEEKPLIDNSKEELIKKVINHSKDSYIERIVIFYSNNTFKEYLPH